MREGNRAHVLGWKTASVSVCAPSVQFPLLCFHAPGCGRHPAAFSGKVHCAVLTLAPRARGHDGETRFLGVSAPGLQGGVSEMGTWRPWHGEAGLSHLYVQGLGLGALGALTSGS